MARDWNAEGAVVADELVSHGHAHWPGVGRFRVVQKEARPGRNPQTGALITIEARRVVKFVADDQFFESMGEKSVVRVRGFGLFEVKVYGAYQGRNPNTGEFIEVAEKRGALFRSDAELRDRIETAPVPAAPEDEAELEA